ncbi:MAG: glycosyltransferase [Azospirillaceae bacterium]
MARRLYRHLRGRLLQDLIPAGRPIADAPCAAPGIEVVGYPGAVAGIAASARLCAAALAGDGYAVSVIDLDRIDPATASPGGAGPPVRIWHLNPPMMPKAVLRFGPRRFAAGINIGYWAWELETFPAEWRKAERYMSAFLVPSRFTAEALARITAKPVGVVPHPVPSPAAADPSALRREAGIATDAFLVATVFNFTSSFERKNPLAAIEAFRRAFGEEECSDTGRPARLVVKTANAARYPDQERRLRAAAEGDSRIAVIDAEWPEGRVQALIAASDAYLSLHRSEGYGLTLAEAIVAGVPVVATGWSGNTDFCDPESSFLVPWRLVPVADPHPAYAGLDGARWAEAEAEAAASALRRLRDDPETARWMARAAQDRLNAHVAANDYAGALRTLGIARPTEGP